MPKRKLKALRETVQNLQAPMPGEHSARIHDPGKYDEIKRKNGEFGPGIDCIYGIKDGKAEIQAIRFDKEKFTPAEAKKWLKDHNYDPIEFEPAKAAAKESCRLDFGFCRLIESDDPEGKEWDVCLIKSGMSLNGVIYEDEVLEKAAPIFENAIVNAFRFSGELYDHLPEPIKAMMPSAALTDKAIGFFKNVIFGPIPGSGDPPVNGLRAKLFISENAKWLRQLMKDAWEQGKRDLLGFSIDAWGQVEDEVRDGLPILVAKTLERADSVDVVSNPAAGGQFLRLAASQDPKTKLKGSSNMDKLRELLIRLFEAIKYAAEGLDPASITESAAADHLRKAAEAQTTNDFNARALKKMLSELAESFSAQKFDEAEKQAKNLLEMLKPLTTDPPKPPESVKESQRQTAEAQAVLREAQKIRDELKAEREIVGCQTKLVIRLAECKLPEIVKGKIQKRFQGIAFKDADLETYIKDEEDVLASLQASHVLGMGGAKTTVGQGSVDRMTLAMDGLLDGKDQIGPDGKPVPRFRGLHEAWRNITGFTGEFGPSEAMHMIGQSSLMAPPLPSESEWNRSGNMLREALVNRRESLKTSSWAEILGETLNRKLIKEYALEPLQEWRKLVSEIGNYKDFKTQYRPRMGGYGILPTVAEQGTYTEATSPTDEQISGALIKKGVLDSWTWEMALNDDIGSLKRIPTRLGRAAARTIYHDVFLHLTLLSGGSGLGYEWDGTTELATSTRANYGTTALSNAQLNVIRLAMRSQAGYGDSYEILGATNEPKYLLVPHDLMQLAHQLCKDEYLVNPTDAFYSTGTAINHPSGVSNINKLMGMEYIIVDEWTDTTDFWCIADPQKMPVLEVGFLGGNENPELFIADNPSQGSALTADKIVMKIRYCYSILFLDYRSFYGSHV